MGQEHSTESSKELRFRNLRNTSLLAWNFTWREANLISRNSYTRNLIKLRCKASVKTIIICQLPVMWPLITCLLSQLFLKKMKVEPSSSSRVWEHNDSVTMLLSGCPVWRWRSEAKWDSNHNNFISGILLGKKLSTSFQRHSVLLSRPGLWSLS
jgi:hypothetical protein